MTLPQYSIYAHWGPRAETPEAIAGRFLQLIDRLAPIDPAFGNWIWARGHTPVQFDTIRDRLAEEVAAQVVRDDWGEPELVHGYSLTAVNSMTDAPKALSISVGAACTVVSEHIINSASIETPWREVPDPAIITFPIFRAAVLALVETHDAVWCSAHPDGMAGRWPGSGDFRFPAGWISYVAPRFAPLITPPATAIVERRPNGGLLMAATDEPFMIDNPAHMAVSRDIDTAVAPLKALPWPIDREAGS